MFLDTHESARITLPVEWYVSPRVLRKHAPVALGLIIDAKIVCICVYLKFGPHDEIESADIAGGTLHRLLNGTSNGSSRTALHTKYFAPLGAAACLLCHLNTTMQKHRVLPIALGYIIPVNYNVGIIIRTYYGVREMITSCVSFQERRSLPLYAPILSSRLLMPYTGRNERINRSLNQGIILRKL